MRLFILAWLVPAAAWAGDLTRVGGYLGEKKSAERAAVEQTVSAPRAVRMTPAEFGRAVLPQLSGGCTVDASGAVRQPYTYILSARGVIEKNFISPGSRSVTILQTVSNGFYLARISAGTRYAEECAVRIPGAPLADGRRLHLQMERADGLYRYTSVLGAVKNVEVYESEPVLPAATDGQILEAFRAGTRFSALLPVDVPCSRCSASGRVEEKKGTFTLRIPCPACGGKKAVQWHGVAVVSPR